MPCFYCGKRVSLVRQLNDPDFCSDEHRARYHDLTRLALGRLLETRERLAPSASKRKSRSAREAERPRPPRPQPAPAEPDLAEFEPEPAVEYTRRDSPSVSAPDGEQHASLVLPELPPEEAGFDLALGSLVQDHPLGAAANRKPRCEPDTEAFVTTVAGTEFPRSAAPAEVGSFPTGSFADVPDATTPTAGRPFRTAQLAFERTPPAVLPATSPLRAPWVPEQAGPAPAVSPDPLGAPGAHAAAAAAFPAPLPVCPAAASKGPVFRAQAVFAASGPVQAIAPAAPRAEMALPPPGFSLEPALPHAETRARVRAAFAPDPELRNIWQPQAMRPVHARSGDAFDLLPIAAGGVSLPVRAAPPIAATALESASFVRPEFVIGPHTFGKTCEVPGSLLQRAPEIPALGAHPLVRVPDSAPGLPWLAKPRNAAMRPLPAPASIGVMAPAWPGIAMAKPAAPRSAGAVAGASWVAKPVAGERASVKKKDDAAAIGTAGPSLPELTHAKRRGAVIDAQGLLPLAGLPTARLGPSASPRVCAFTVMAGPEVALPALSGPRRPESKLVGPGWEPGCRLGARPTGELRPASIGLAAPRLTIPALAADGIGCRGLDVVRFLPPPASGAQAVTPVRVTSPVDLPAAGPACPESEPVAILRRLGRTLAIPYAIRPTGDRSRGRAAGFAQAPLTPVMPAARALARVPRLAGAGGEPLASAPVAATSKAAGCAWQAAPAAIRLPLAPAALSAPAIQPPAGVFPAAAPGAHAQAAEVRTEGYAPFSQPAVLRPQSAGFVNVLTAAALRAIGQPAPVNRLAAAALVPPPPIRKVNRRALVPRMRSAMAGARMPQGVFRPLEVPDFDDDNTVRIGAGYPAAGPGPAIPPLRFGPKCAEQPRPAVFVPALVSPAAGTAASPWASAPFLPRNAILPRPATPLMEFDFYGTAAPRERGWSFVPSVFRVVLFCMALPPATQPPGLEPPAAGFEGLNTHAVDRVVSDRAVAQWISKRG